MGISFSTVLLKALFFSEKHSFVLEVYLRSVFIYMFSLRCIIDKRGRNGSAHMVPKNIESDLKIFYINFYDSLYIF